MHRPWALALQASEEVWCGGGVTRHKIDTAARDTPLLPCPVQLGKPPLPVMRIHLLLWTRCLARDDDKRCSFICKWTFSKLPKLGAFCRNPRRQGELDAIRSTPAVHGTREARVPSPTIFTWLRHHNTAGSVIGSPGIRTVPRVGRTLSRRIGNPRGCTSRTQETVGTGGPSLPLLCRCRIVFLLRCTALVLQCPAWSCAD